MTEFEDTRNQQQAFKRMGDLFDRAKDMERPEITEELLHVPIGAYISMFSVDMDDNGIEEKVFQLAGTLMDYMKDLTDGDPQLNGLILCELLTTLAGSEIKGASEYHGKTKDVDQETLDNLQLVHKDHNKDAGSAIFGKFRFAIAADLVGVTLKRGINVKVRITDADKEDAPFERIWVMIESVHGNHITGRVNNVPVSFGAVLYQKIVFHINNVFEVNIP